MTRSNLPTTTTIYKGEQGEPFVFALLDSTAMLPCLAVVPTQSTLVSCSLPSFYVSEPTLNCCELLWVVLPLLDLFYRTNPRNPCELLSPLFWCQIISSLMSKQLHLSPLSMSLKHSQPLSLCVRFSTHILMLFEHFELFWAFLFSIFPLSYWKPIVLLLLFPIFLPPNLTRWAFPMWPPLDLWAFAEPETDMWLSTRICSCQGEEDFLRRIISREIP